MMLGEGKSPIHNGLRDITVAEYWKLPLIISGTLERKLLGLPVDARRHPELSNQILDAMHLLRTVGTREYGDLSLLALLDVLLAVDKFLVLYDENPDSHTDGYDDDAKIVAAAFQKHKKEIERFRLWFHSRT